MTLTETPLIWNRRTCYGATGSVKVIHYKKSKGLNSGLKNSAFIYGLHITQYIPLQQTYSLIQLSG